MTKLIDADALLEKLNYQGGFCEDDEMYNLITDAPTIEADSASEIAELKDRLHEIALDWQVNQAHINDLREALEKAMNDEAGWYEIAKQALSATPAESLQAHDAETIKRYADDLDNNHWVFIPHDLRKPLKEVK